MYQRDIWMDQFVKKDWRSRFPNIEIALRIYHRIMSSNCSGERLFSKLNLIKNLLRTVVKDDRPSALSIMNIEVKILNITEFDDILNVFVDKKLRKQWSTKPSWWYHGNFVQLFNSYSHLIFVKTALFHCCKNLVFYCVAWFYILIIILLSSFYFTVAMMTVGV